MKTLDELNQLLSRQAPSDPLVKLLNDTFGPLGWEYGEYTLKVMAKVSDGHFLSVSRSAANMAAASALFGLEVKNEQINEVERSVDRAEAPSHGARADSALMGATSDRVGQGAGEPEPSIPAGTPKPSRKVINDSISATSQVILAKKLRTQDELKKMLEAYGVTNKSQLTDDQAVELLGQLNVITKE